MYCNLSEWDAPTEQKLWWKFLPWEYSSADVQQAEIVARRLWPTESAAIRLVERPGNIPHVIYTALGLLWPEYLLTYGTGQGQQYRTKYPSRSHKLNSLYNCSGQAAKYISPTPIVKLNNKVERPVIRKTIQVLASDSYPTDVMKKLVVYFIEKNIAQCISTVKEHNSRDCNHFSISYNNRA